MVDDSYIPKLCCTSPLSYTLATDAYPYKSSPLIILLMAWDTGKIKIVFDSCKLHMT